MDDYGNGETRQIKTFAEKCLPPLGTYLVRKCVLGFILVLLFVVRQFSRVYGFNFSAEVSDREEWVWELREKVPLYRARVERMD